MDGYLGRGIFFTFLFGGIGVMFARGLADWFEWQSWTLRIIGAILLAVGVVEVWMLLGYVPGLKSLLAVVIGVPLYVWQDAIAERREQEGDDER